MAVMDRDHIKQAVKEAADIVAVVSQYTDLSSAGKRMKGISPFTNEKTPSFFVDPEEGLYYCFSSQKGGDVFTFVQEVEGVDFKGALNLLADRFGVSVSSSGGSGRNNAPLYQALESAASFYRKQITDEVRRYLFSRGISEQSVSVWGIGYAPDSWNSFCGRRMPHLESAVRAGVCVQKDSSVYDRFRNRVIFPFCDSNGRVIAFSGRLYGDADAAKYINSPESPLFDKSSFLYGLHRAKPSIRKHNMSLLTEGPIDTIMAHQAGYPMTVATSGTAVTERHLRQLQRLSNRLLLSLDGDAAGMRATFRVIGTALSLGMDVKVAVLPDGKDPADVIAENPDTFALSVRNASPVIAFMIRGVKNHYGTAGEDLIRGVHEILLPVVADIRDPLMKHHAIQEIASCCSLDPGLVGRSVAAVRSGRSMRQVVGVRGRSAAGRVEDMSAKRQKRIDTFLRIVGTARTFLSEDLLTDTIRRDLQYVERTERVPVIDAKLAKMRYEEQFSSADRVDRVREELEDTLKRLCPELRKRDEMKKTLV